jgi:hypothetical protein
MADGCTEVSGATALALVAGTGLALLAPTSWFALVRRRLRRQAARERAAFGADPFALRPGVVAIAGTVETIEGDAPPVSVVLEEADHAEKGWIETGRRIEARPFVLRLANGVRVQVEPGEAPELRDALGAVEPLGERRRRRVARLTVGERVFVRGQLDAPVPAEPGDAAYRGTAERAVISTPRRGPLVLSTEALGGEAGGHAVALEFQLHALVFTLVVTQLPYAYFYIECARYWLGGGEPPTIVLELFFWVGLVAFSVILGAVLSAWNERPWHRR